MTWTLNLSCFDDIVLNITYQFLSSSHRDCISFPQISDSIFINFDIMVTCRDYLTFTHIQAKSLDVIVPAETTY